MLCFGTHICHELLTFGIVHSRTISKELMHRQHPLVPSSDVLRQRVLCNKASSRGRLIGQNRFCAISCNCTKQFCAISCYRTKRVLCNKASRTGTQNKTLHFQSLEELPSSDTLSWADGLVLVYSITDRFAIIPNLSLHLSKKIQEYSTKIQKDLSWFSPSLTS